MSSTPSVHLQSTQARHLICLSFTRIQPPQPPTPSMLPSSLSLRLSGILSWCNKKSPSASLIPYHLAHSQPHIDDGVLVPVGTSQVVTPLLRFYRSSYRLGHPIGTGICMHGPVEMAPSYLRPDGIHLSQNNFSFRLTGPAREGRGCTKES